MHSLPAGRRFRAPSAVLATVAVLALLASPGAVAQGDDPLRRGQYGLDLTGLGAAADASGGAPGVIVAVIDSGVDLTHPDLQGVLVPGTDLVDGDEDPTDENGHGTHVAGIIAAGTRNGIGIAGGAPGALIMPIRALNREGIGDDALAAAGVRHAVRNGAKVVNLSLGESGLFAKLGPGGPLAVAIIEAAAKGVVVIAAAGNDGEAAKSYRVGVPLLVASAVDQEGVPAEFTNFGDAREVAAPGVEILSTVPLAPTFIFPRGTNGYQTLDGTSFAAPHVSALAALMVHRGADPERISEVMLRTARNPDRDPRLGSGLIDAVAALDALGPMPDTTTSTTSTDNSEQNEGLIVVGTVMLCVVVLVALLRAPRREQLV